VFDRYIPLDEAHKTAMVTKIVFFELKESKQCIIVMEAVFSKTQIRPYHFVSLITLVRQMRKIT
jgi:hypothetical protein